MPAPTQGSEFAELRQLILELQLELRRLRRDNELLRQAQVAAPATGAPCHPTGTPFPSPLVATPLLNPTLQLPLPSFSPIKPVDTSAPMLTPQKEVHARQPGDGTTPEAKRPSGAARSNPNV